MAQTVQWHHYRRADPGLQWLLDLFRRAVRRMDEQGA